MRRHEPLSLFRSLGSLSLAGEGIRRLGILCHRSPLDLRVQSTPLASECFF